MSRPNRKRRWMRPGLSHHSRTELLKWRKLKLRMRPPAKRIAAADFVPVPFTEAIGPEDPGMVVRVQLTRASLAELGYPVAEMPDEDLIRADVLVGEDGWPRGVRLVQ